MNRNKSTKSKSSQKLAMPRSRLSPTEVGGFTDSQRVTLRYIETIGLSATTGSTVWYVYRGNSVFDPNLTGTGVQPANYDDYSLQYNKYRVHGSGIRVLSSTYSATPSSVPFIFVLSARHASSNPSSLEDAASMPYSELHYRGAYHSPNLDIPVGWSTSTQEFLGLDRATFLGGDEFSAQTNANPAHQWFWVFGIRAVDGASTVAPTITVTLDYDVEFYDRVETTLDSMRMRIQNLSAPRGTATASEEGDQKEWKFIDRHIETSSSAPPYRVGKKPERMHIGDESPPCTPSRCGPQEVPRVNRSSTVH